jgi:hypothetical protein
MARHDQKHQANCFELTDCHSRETLQTLKQCGKVIQNRIHTADFIALLGLIFYGVLAQFGVCQSDLQKHGNQSNDEPMHKVAISPKAGRISLGQTPYLHLTAWQVLRLRIRVLKESRHQNSRTGRRIAIVLRLEPL